MWKEIQTNERRQKKDWKREWYQGIYLIPSLMHHELTLSSVKWSGSPEVVFSKCLCLSSFWKLLLPYPIRHRGLWQARSTSSWIFYSPLGLLKLHLLNDPLLISSRLLNLFWVCGFLLGLGCRDRSSWED